MNIIELAKECNLYATENSYTLYTKELEAFATAAIENYKAGLVPVAYGVTGNDGKVFFLKATITLDGHTSTPLYALGETK